MVYVILALAIITIGFAIYSIVLTSQKSVMARDLAAAKAAITTASSANSSVVDENARKDRLIASLKDEITQLEQDIETCSSPDAVRAALRSLSASLSGGPSTGDHVSANTAPPNTGVANRRT